MNPKLTEFYETEAIDQKIWFLGKCAGYAGEPGQFGTHPYIYIYMFKVCGVYHDSLKS